MDASTTADSPTVRLEREFIEFYRACQPATMVDWKRCYSLYQATNYVMQSNVPGALVECGVYRGGCCALMALTAIARGDQSRDLYLYDTFAGMAQPGERDVRCKDSERALDTWRAKQTDERNDWCFASLKDVQAIVGATGYPAGRLHFIEGLVEQTIPEYAPDQIALLRLDTDWYDSTYHELTHLYPRLSVGGVIIFDDYNYWKGQREAVDQYFSEQGIEMPLSNVSTSTMGMKPA